MFAYIFICIRCIKSQIIIHYYIASCFKHADNFTSNPMYTREHCDKRTHTRCQTHANTVSNAREHCDKRTRTTCQTHAITVTNAREHSDVTIVAAYIWFPEPARGGTRAPLSYPTPTPPD